MEPATHPGFSCEYMREDKRKAEELAEEFVGKKIGEKLSSNEFKTYLYAFIHVIIARSNKDIDLHFNIQLVSLRALKYKLMIMN